MKAYLAYAQWTNPRIEEVEIEAWDETEPWIWFLFDVGRDVCEDHPGCLPRNVQLNRSTRYCKTYKEASDYIIETIEGRIAKMMHKLNKFIYERIEDVPTQGDT